MVKVKYVGDITPGRIVVGNNTLEVVRGEEYKVSEELAEALLELSTFEAVDGRRVRRKPEPEPESEPEPEDEDEDEDLDLEVEEDE